MNIPEILNKMSSITRWSQCFCHKPESVLEHTAVVSFLSLQMGRELGADMGKLLERCILHDIEEVITGDIPTPTKYNNKDIENALKKFEDKAAREVCKCLGDWAYVSWSESKDKSLEGDILRLADTIAVLYKIEQEVKLGNLLFVEFIPNCKDAFIKFKTISITKDTNELADYYIGYINENYKKLC